tara:strand:- start:2192 stop:3223 length:1032 start_codon:yes stop_codon:yes gene_type:complete
LEKIYSKAPLRIGLSGGGTDVSPYPENNGGAVLNATINLYANVTLFKRDDDKIVIYNFNNKLKYTFNKSKKLKIIKEIALQIGAYNYIIKKFNLKPFSFELISYLDVPSGSGLGTSSTLLVAILGVFLEWYRIPMGKYEISKLAVEIERNYLNQAGGMQDQYASVFGGFNFLEFKANNQVIVNPLRLNDNIIEEIRYNLVLFYTNLSRESSSIIEKQNLNYRNNKRSVVNALNNLKIFSYDLKDSILLDCPEKMGEILNKSWNNKKRLASDISNKSIDKIYSLAIENGSTGGKISGAGGGGFMIFYCPGVSKFKVIEELSKIGVKKQTYSFEKEGLKVWKSTI